MSEPETIKARFRVSKTHVIVTAVFHNVTAQLAWKHGDEETTRHINAMIANLPALVRDGIAEVTIKKQMQDIDREYRELFPDLEEDGEETSE